MKTIIYSKTKSFNNIYIKCVLYTLALLLWVIKTQAQAYEIIPFAPRTSMFAPSEFQGKSSYNLRGDFAIIGNSNYKTNLAGSPYYISNSSSANLQLPEGMNKAATKIIYAGLYWFGQGYRYGENSGAKFIKFKTPTMTDYTSLEAKTTDIYFGTNSHLISARYAEEYRALFVGYYDVTELVRNGGLGTYSVGNIYTEELSEGLPESTIDVNCAGWGMVIVYENELLEPQNITVFDGFNFIRPQISADDAIGRFNLTGFHTPKSGPIKVKLGFMTKLKENADSRSISYLEILKPDYIYMKLSHPLNTVDHFFNSSIYTGGNLRTPNNSFNDGVNLAVIDLPNEGNINMANNQTTAYFKYKASSSNLCAFNFVTSVTTYIPRLDALLTPLSTLKNNAIVTPDDILEFKLDLRNKGNEDIKDGKIEINLPINLNFVSANTLSNGVSGIWSSPNGTNPLTTAGGTIVWDMGNIPLNDNIDAILATLNFTVKVDNNCAMLYTSTSGCGKSITIKGKSTATGVISNINSTWDLVTSYTLVDNIKTPVRDFFNLKIQPTIKCDDVTEDGFKVFKACNNDIMPRSTITKAYPNGTKFYSQIPNTPGFEDTIVNGDFTIKANNGIIKYYAIVDGMPTDCYFKLQTQYGNCYMMSNPMIPAKFKTQ